MKKSLRLPCGVGNTTKEHLFFLSVLFGLRAGVKTFCVQDPERVDDLRAVMDAAGAERALLYGASEGGPTCLLFAATYPNRVDSVYSTGRRGSPPTGRH